MKIQKIDFIKFQDGQTRLELDQETLHDIARALMAQAHNDHCAPEYKDHCYKLGREFMAVWKAKPAPTIFDDLMEEPRAQEIDGTIERVRPNPAPATTWDDPTWRDGV